MPANICALPHNLSQYYSSRPSVMRNRACSASDFLYNTGSAGRKLQCCDNCPRFPYSGKVSATLGTIQCIRCILLPTTRTLMGSSTWGNMLEENETTFFNDRPVEQFVNHGHRPQQQSEHAPRYASFSWLPRYAVQANCFVKHDPPWSWRKTVTLPVLSKIEEVVLCIYGRPVHYMMMKFPTQLC